MRKLIVHIFLAVLIPCTLLSTAYLMSGSRLNPEQKILGNWKEVAWTYEKADRKGATSFSEQAISDSMKKLILESKIIHESEQWSFTKDSGLVLAKAKNRRNIRWALMGSGNILKLKYNERIYEYYNLIELSNKRLVLHFESDLLTRGIVKITFER